MIENLKEPIRLLETSVENFYAGNDVYKVGPWICKNVLKREGQNIFANIFGTD